MKQPQLLNHPVMTGSYSEIKAALITLTSMKRFTTARTNFNGLAKLPHLLEQRKSILTKFGETE